MQIETLINEPEVRITMTLSEAVRLRDDLLSKSLNPNSVLCLAAGLTTEIDSNSNDPHHLRETERTQDG